MDMVDLSAMGIPEELGEFRAVVQKFEREARTEEQVRLLRTSLENEDRKRWASYFNKLLTSTYTVRKLAQWIEAETLFWIDRYGLYEELGYGSFAEFVRQIYSSNWGYTLKNAFSVRHRFGIHPGHELWETLLKIENIQYLEGIAGIANEQNYQSLICRGAGVGEESPIDVFALRELKQELQREITKREEPATEEEWNDLIEIAIEKTSPRIIAGWQWKEIQKAAKEIIGSEEVSVKIEPRSGGKKVIITITRTENT